MEATKRIEKEDISSLSFPKEEVLTTEEGKNKRKQMLEMAEDYGNEAQYKVKIVFEDQGGPKVVHTTIWDVDKKNVFLKENVTIPIHRIRKIVFPEVSLDS